MHVVDRLRSSPSECPRFWRARSYLSLRRVLGGQFAHKLAAPCTKAADAGRLSQPAVPAPALRSATAGSDESSVCLGLARQRIVFAFVEPADTIAVEALFLDFQVGAEQQFGRQLLDRKADRLRGGRKTLVSDRSAGFAAAAWEQLRRCPVIDERHQQ